MIYCRKCGAELKDSAKFCDSCGSEVIKVKQRSYQEKYDDKKKKMKENTLSKQEKERKEKHKDEKNPYVGAALFAVIIAFVLSVFPWSYIKEGLGTSLGMRIAVVAFALLSDYHCTKAKQTNNLLYSRYGFRIQENTVKVVNVFAIVMTMIGLFALFMYGA